MPLLSADPKCLMFLGCPCSGSAKANSLLCLSRKGLFSGKQRHIRGSRCRVCMFAGGGGDPNWTLKLGNPVNGNLEAQKLYVVRRLSNELGYEELGEERTKMARSQFTGFPEDPMVNKLSAQLGVIHPLPAPPMNRGVAGLFAFFFFFGLVFDKLLTWWKRNQAVAEARAGIWPQVPTSFSLFLEKDLQRKESVEWVNMVVAKLWKVYKEALENWVIGLLQPVIDDLVKPDYVQRVEIKQFSLGEEPLSVRNVERRTSRRANDLQYQIGLRYTGDARMLLSLKLKFGIIPVVVPVGIRDFDIDGELWVKLRLIPSEPWIGAAQWAFVSLPKIKFELSPFRLFNLMAIPVLSMFLLKLLTEDLPRLFVRPKKIVLDFQKGKALGPVPDYFHTATVQEGNKDCVGELSITLVDAQKLPYAFFAKTDPYVVLSLGDQVIRSKKNSQTTVIGPPGEPIWNQDFHMLVMNPRKQKLNIQVKDSIGFADITVGSGEIDLGSLQDTVPTDRIVALRGGWGFFSRIPTGEILLRLTYKAYVEDEDDDSLKMETMDDNDASDDELLDSDETNNSDEQSKIDYVSQRESDSFMNVLTALLVSEEFQGIVSSEIGSSRNAKRSINVGGTASRPRGRNADFSIIETESTLESFGESTLLWLAAITGLAVLISVSFDGTNLFNP